ncbi:MAG: AMMECR1 domain-containing protein [Firmicutes bacterium]|nr:AMMECR1 domain-containing protein [Bacillota bacterium]
MAQKILIVLIFLFLAAVSAGAQIQTGQPDNHEKKLLLDYARQSIVKKLSGQIFTPSLPKNSRLCELRKPVFVTLEKDGKVRGCRGALEPAGKNIAEEVCIMAIAAALGDKRFPPLTKPGLKKSRISITIVSELIPYSGGNIPKEDGIIYKKDGTAGIVLPYEGSDTFTRIRWAYIKAGITPPDRPENIKNQDLYIMKAERFADGDL